MLDTLASIGSIKGPSGTLEFGNVGATGCVFLRYVGGPGAVPLIVYSPEELTTLLAIVRYAEKLAQTTQPGAILRLGAMRAKPIVLRLALIHPNQGQPFLLLRMLSGRGKLDVPVPITAALELFRQGEVSDPAPPVCGMLRRDPEGVWLISSRELHPIPNQTAGYGFFGEYLHPDEVREGEELVAWTLPLGGKEYVGAFRTLQHWQPPAQVNEPMAQEGDIALFQGETYRCRQIHKTFAQTLMGSGNVPPTWAAKIALSSLLCDIADGEDETGHTTWVGNSPEPILQLGIAAMEQGQTSPHDLAIYQEVSCYFHSLGADQDGAAHAVNTILERLFAHISETDPQQRRRMLGNWAMHLKEIYDGKPPAEVSEAWKRAKARYPGRVVPKVISFPPPYPWVLDWSSGAQADEATVTDEPAPSAPVQPGLEPQPASVLFDPPQTEPELDAFVPEKAAQVQASDEPPAAAPSSVPSVEPESPPLPVAKKSKAPLLAVGALVAVGLAFAAYQATGTGPEPAQTPLSATGSPAPPATASPAASGAPAATASATAVPAATETAQPAGTPGAPILGDLSNLGKISVGGVDPEGKYYVDRDVPGMKMLESGPGWARYEKDGYQVFMGAEQSGSRKGTRASAFASEVLFSDGKKVLSAGVTLDQIPQEALNRLVNSRIRVVVDEATDTVMGFSTGEFPETTIALGQPLGAPLMQAFEQRDLDAFKAGLTAETANLTFMDGETLFSKVARQAGVNDYCQALIDAGADVKGTVGIKALWATTDPAIAAMLIKAGLSPDEPGPKGQTKLFGAGPEMTRVLLEAGANPNAQDQDGASPLIVATEAAAVEALLKGGANPNQPDSQGRTPLMGADMEKTRALLLGGADPALKDKEGRTAIDYAGPDVDVVELLRNPPGKTPPKAPPTPKASPSPKTTR